MNQRPGREEAQVRARVLISGRVQGVGFRFAARQEAQQQGLSGWVRNRADGSVEAVVEGEGAGVQACLAWCRRGPRGAVVTDVQVTWEPYQGEPQGFRIVG
jgi:acylphosphatase